MFTIKAVTSLTGLKPETLRAWEKRYGLIEPRRDENGRRLYRPEDLQRLDLLARATRQGHAIGKIAGLDISRLQALVDQTSPEEADYHALQQQIIEALTHYQTQQCEKLLKRAMIALSPLAYARDILLPLLNQIGDLWHQNRLTIAQEHIFSACVKRIVLSMVNNLSTHAVDSRRILFATLSGERHEFGILLTCLVAADLGLTCQYIGPDLPAEELIEAARRLKPTHVVLSAVSNENMNELARQLSQLSDALSPAMQLWIGGQASALLRQQSHLPKPWKQVVSLDDFQQKLQAKPSLANNTLSDY